MNLFDLHSDTALEAYKHKKSIGDFSLPLKNPPYERLTQTLAVFLHDDLRGAGGEAPEELFFKVLGHMKADPLFQGGGFCPLIAVENAGWCCRNDLGFLHRASTSGVRLVSLSWNADNPLCGGNRGSGAGLSRAGREAAALCERLGMVLDVSHCSDAAFDDFSAVCQKPFIASHSNSRAVCEHTRNLTDGQIRDIIARGGLVGLNFYVRFLDSRDENAGIEAVLRHADHILALGGEDALAIGSDYDGADIADELREPGGLYAAMAERYGAETADKIFYYNAERFFTAQGVL